MRKLPFIRLAAALLAASALVPAFADDLATLPEAQERLKALSALVKTKGLQPAANEVMAPADPLKCKYKDIACMIISDAGKFLANTSQPALVGNSLPLDLKDPDGKPILGQQVGPLKEGKTKWEARFKFVRPGTKTIVSRLSLCEKVADNMVACVVVSQP